MARTLNLKHTGAAGVTQARDDREYAAELMRNSDGDIWKQIARVKFKIQDLMTEEAFDEFYQKRPLAPIGQWNFLSKQLEALQGK